MHFSKNKIIEGHGRGGGLGGHRLGFGRGLVYNRGYYGGGGALNVNPLYIYDVEPYPYYYSYYNSYY